MTQNQIEYLKKMVGMGCLVWWQNCNSNYEDEYVKCKEITGPGESGKYFLVGDHHTIVLNESDGDPTVTPDKFVITCGNIGRIPNE